jgi:uncharacterized membrane-anchored protein
MGGAGMFAVSIYMIFMGGYYDRLIAAKLPAGADVVSYSAPTATAEMASALNRAKAEAGPEIINVTLIIPIILVIAFAILFFYMRGRAKQLSPAAELKVESQPIL